MSSVTKTLNLLNYFSQNNPEIGLSQLCRLAGRNKATTHRHLQAMEEAGFVEQNKDTKLYRLGPALLHLAQLRDNSVPQLSGMREILDKLSHATGETAHLSVLYGSALHVIASIESRTHADHVVMDIQSLPLHATAAGICALTFGPPELRAQMDADFPRFTSDTARNAVALDAQIAQTRATGFGRGAGSFEEGTHSLAAPLFDKDGGFAGAVAVASLEARFTEALQAKIKAQLIATSFEITTKWGGALPASLLELWKNALPVTPVSR